MKDEHEHDNEQELKMHHKQLEALISGGPVSATSVASILSFPAFDPTSKTLEWLLSQIWHFTEANSIPKANLAQVFLANQRASFYELIGILAQQQGPPKHINDLTMKIL